MIDILKYADENKIPRPIAIDDKEFRDFFNGIKIDVAVEIGTQRGLSAAWIAQFANQVYTFDIVAYKEKYKIWEDLEVEKNITAIKLLSEHNLIEILGMINFDFAFIDGDHSYEAVKADFEKVKHCGKVLFHDTAPRENGAHDGVRKFIKELGNVKVTGNIGYWEAK